MAGNVELGELLMRLLSTDRWLLLRMSSDGAVTTMLSNCQDEAEIIDWLRQHADAVEAQSYDSRTEHDVKGSG